VVFKKGVVRSAVFSNCLALLPGFFSVPVSEFWVVFSGVDIGVKQVLRLSMERIPFAPPFGLAFFFLVPFPFFPLDTSIPLSVCYTWEDESLCVALRPVFFDFWLRVRSAFFFCLQIEAWRFFFFLASRS